MLENVDLSELEVRKFSGADTSPKYQPQHAAPASPPDSLIMPDPVSEEMSVTQRYTGNCHCGQFKFSLDMPDLKSASVKTCECSICTRVCLSSSSFSSREGC